MYPAHKHGLAEYGCCIRSLLSSLARKIDDVVRRLSHCRHTKKMLIPL
jgi:hypothetical protein